MTDKLKPKMSKLTIDKVLKLDDISTIQDTIHENRADIDEMVVVYRVKGENYYHTLCTEMTSFDACAMLEWAKMDMYNRSEEVEDE